MCRLRHPGMGLLQSVESRFERLAILGQIELLDRSISRIYPLLNPRGHNCGYESKDRPKGRYGEIR